MRVDVEIVEVIGRVVRGCLFCCADWIGVDAPVAHSVGVCLEICHLLLTAWEVAIDAGTASPVVGLVCDVSGVAEDDDGGDWKRLGLRASVVDNSTHSCYQGSFPDPWQVCLVVRSR